MIGNYFFSNSGGAEAYQLEQSLRFNRSSSHYLYLNGGWGNPTDATKFTISVWVKRAGLGTDQCIMGSSPASTLWSDLKFQNDDRLVFRQYHTSGGPSLWAIATNHLFRDTSAWYHIVLEFDSTQSTASDRLTLHVNGEEITSFQQASYPGQNYTSFVASGGYATGIGRLYNFKTDYFDGYMSEFHYIDGTVYDPTYFGEYNNDGVWIPKEVTGLTYGNKGVYLKFDPSATNGIGHNHGGSLNWTASSFTTSGAGSDVVDDTPTVNQATVQPTWPFGVSQAYGRYFADGNLTYHSGRNSPALAYPSILLPKSGKYYVEFTVTAGGSGGSFYAGNLFVISDPKTGNSYGTSVTSYEGGYGATTYNGSAGSSGSSWRSGPHNVAIAIDMDTGAVEYFLAGVSQSTGTISAANLALDNLCITMSGATGSSTTVTYDINFGTRDFVYTPPTGYTGISTATLPAPDITNPGEYFNTVLYTGNGSTQSITGVGFKPDLVWIKCRSAGTDHVMTDVVRGTNKVIRPNTHINGYTQSDSVTSFDADGFSLGDDNDGGPAGNFNVNGRTYVAWCWKAGGTGTSNTDGTITSTVSASPTSGFSIVTWTGTGSNGSVGHGLGKKPKLLFVKDTTNSYNWYVFCNATGDNLRIEGLNTTAGATTQNGHYNASTTLISNLTSSASLNTSGATMLMYCFADVPGHCKVGAYTGTGSDDGAFIYLGFRPKFFLVKSALNTADDWVLMDIERSPFSPMNDHFAVNHSYQEVSNSTETNMDFVSNGVKLRDSNGKINASGSTYIYLAMAEHPFGGEGVSPAPAR